MKRFLLERIQLKQIRLKRVNKRTRAAAILLLLLLCLFTGCKSGAAKDDHITIVTREDGSGTRKAFVKLTGIQKDKQDRTTLQAEVTNSNFVMMMSIAGDENAIGYVSLCSLGNDVKAVRIDGVEPTVEAVKEGKYSLVRNFYLVVPTDLSVAGEDFIRYILSAKGQEVIERQGYIGEGRDNTYRGAEIKGEKNGEKKREVRGKVTMAGSTSAAPVLELLVEEYKKKNANVTFEIQQTGSSAGIESVAEGVCDIGLTSRELTSTEISRELKEIKFARDGIAVIVNKKNPLCDISSKTIAEIYMGYITNWEDVY